LLCELSLTFLACDFSFDVSEGTILCTDLVSPQGALNGANAHLVHQGQPPAVPKPPLEFWSDVAWLQWENLCQQKIKEVKGLRRIVSCNIDNEETIKVIEQVVGAGKPDYDGEIFLFPLPKALSLLGTANGQGVGYLLSQHKDDSQLGSKHIHQVQVFRGGAARKWFMVFLLKNA
jgi:hypothetical protein